MRYWLGRNQKERLRSLELAAGLGLAQTKQQAPMTPATPENDQTWLPPLGENLQFDLPSLSLDIPNVTQISALEEDKVTNLSQCLPENDCTPFQDYLSTRLILPQKESKLEGEISVDRGKLTDELHSRLLLPTREDRRTRFAVS